MTVGIHRRSNVCVYVKKKKILPLPQVSFPTFTAGSTKIQKNQNTNGVHRIEFVNRRASSLSGKMSSRLSGGKIVCTHVFFSRSGPPPLRTIYLCARCSRSDRRWHTPSTAHGDGVLKAFIRTRGVGRSARRFYARGRNGPPAGTGRGGN